MYTLLWLLAVVLVVVGVWRMLHGDVLGGFVLIVVGLLIGPGGVSLLSMAIGHPYPNRMPTHRAEGLGWSTRRRMIRPRRRTTIDTWLAIGIAAPLVALVVAVWLSIDA